MENNKIFVHLRSRSAYSLAQGAIPINELVELSKKENMPALALTDEGNLFGALEFSLHAVKLGIQPIVGCILDIDVSNNKNNFYKNDENSVSKILLLVSNHNGWKNLSYLVSNSFLDSKEGIKRPTKLRDLFEKSDGLICLLGGVEGPIGKILNSGKYSEAKNLIQKFKSSFKEKLFIELMRHGIEEEKKIEKLFLKISSEMDIPLVATNNIYFSSNKIYEAHDCLMCIAQSTTISDVNRKRLNEEHFFKSQSSMMSLFSDIPEAISNTISVAKKCLFMPEKREPSLPKYPLSKNKNEFDLLSELSTKGLKNRLKLIEENVKSIENDIYYNRLSYELDVIKKTGFSGYFLIVAEFVNWAKKSNIPVGPGRGSGAGSLVAWSLRITDLNPIKYNLLFERFLNPERVSMPDFDIDFCPSKRDEVIRHVQEVYGSDKVAQIITFGSLKAKAVLRDVGRVLEIPFSKVDNICRMIPIDPSNPTKPYSLKEAIDNEPRLKSAQKSDEEVDQLFKISFKLEGLYKNASTHAAGVVIGDKSLIELLPLYKDPKSNLAATQYDMKNTELAGLVKFDFLGLKTLSIIDMAASMLKLEIPEFNIDHIPLNDNKVYDSISQGNTVGVFQLEGIGVTDVLRKLRPDHFEDLMAVVALYRPGPMDNIPSFIRRKHKKEKIEVLHPLLDDILKETYGIMVYQEQVMESAQKLAGYTLGEADILRKAMGKKIESEMLAQREVFIKGAKKNNIKTNIAIQIFDIMARFAGYGFNKSHAAAYALIAYQTAWFKTHHPEIFLASLMSYDSDSAEKLNIFRNDLLRLKINLLGPDVNASNYNYTVEKDKNNNLSVRTGLCSIKNVGKGITDKIVNERLNGKKFEDILEFSSRMTDGQFGKSHFEYLSLSGCFDSICSNRNLIYQSSEILANCSNRSFIDREAQQENLFSENTDLSELWKLPVVNEWNEEERLEKERNSLGFYYSGHPLEKYESIIKMLSIKDSRQIDNINNLIFYSSGVVSQVFERSSTHGRFARLQISDLKGIYEATVYSEIYSIKRELLYSKSVLLFQLSVVEDSSGSKNIIAKDLWSLDDKLDDFIDGYEIKINENADIKNIKDLLKIKNNHHKNRQKIIKFLVPLESHKEVTISASDRICFNLSIFEELKKLPGIVNITPIISNSL